MKVLVVGNGGREHALAWKLLQSPTVTQVFCTPGNGGTAILDRCQNVQIAVDDFAAIASLALNEQIDLIVVGPELPLSLGITDYLAQYKLRVFGPTQQGSQLEASKSWAKSLMISSGVPTAQGQTFSEAKSAKDYIREKGVPIVVKADGLAAGKGVVVATTLEQALKAVDELFGANFSQVVVEEYLEGEEVSVLALTDGVSVRSLIPAQDHKRIGEGDTGKNTGGMGAYAPAPVATPEIIKQVEEAILAPIVAGLRQQGIDYRGVLYAGLMISPQKAIKVLEFNCRFGDPETQAVLPLLKTPLDELLLACCEQRLALLPPLEWISGSAVCVVAAAGGYPDAYEKGKVIAGIAEAETSGAVVFHAGTELRDGEICTSGGRVLGITAIGSNFERAIEDVYQAVRYIHFEGMYYRRDIGHRCQRAHQGLSNSGANIN